MGGNAFNFELSRIPKDMWKDTVKYIVNTLSYPGFDYNYAVHNVMGSVGQKKTSGDIDIAMNNIPACFVGEKDTPVFDKYDFNKHIRSIIGNNFVNSKGLKQGVIITAWPIAGNSKNGFVQVDFIFGNNEYLKFTHYSPGSKSRFKGVFLTQTIAVLIKMNKDYETFNENNLRTNRVGLRLDLEKGVFRRWETLTKGEVDTKPVSPEYFESVNTNVPRFRRINYIDDVETILRLAFGFSVSFEQVDTFEKAVKFIKENYSKTFFDDFKQRVIRSFMNSSAKNIITYEELINDPVWYQ